MRYTITITLGCPLADAVAGLRSVTDEGDELLAGLESAVAVEVTREPAPALSVGVAETVATYHRAGSVKATAKALGIARSTVRARLAREGIELPANDDATAADGSRPTERAPRRYGAG